MKKTIVLILCIFTVLVSCDKKKDDQNNLAPDKLAKLKKAEAELSELIEEQEKLEKELDKLLSETGSALSDLQIDDKANDFDALNDGSMYDEIPEIEKPKALYGTKALFPTEYAYLKPDFKYKSLIAWKKWNKKANGENDECYSYEYKPVEAKSDCWKCIEYRHIDGKKERIQGDRVYSNAEWKNLIKGKKNSIKAIQIPNFKAKTYFHFNEKAQLSEIKTRAYYGWCLYNIKYDGEKIIEATFYLLGSGTDNERYKFTKFDAYGNWLEANVYVNGAKEVSYTKVREIEYYK